MDESFDVVVVGGGAAGLSAATILGRSRRSVLVVDEGKPRNAPAEGVHGFLSRDGISPARLLEIGRTEARSYGVEVRAGVATSASVEGDGFTVTLASGQVVTARRLVVTTGLVDGLPDVTGLAERWGRDVVHCPYCHGWEVRDQRIVVLASTPMSTHQALLFRQLSDDVTVVLHGVPAPTGEDAERLARRGVRLVEGPAEALEVQADRLVGVRLASGEVLPADAVTVQSTVVARSGVLTSLGLETTDLVMGETVLGEYVDADVTGRTAVPGVFVAGNVREPMAQVVSAAAAGTFVGAQVNADLVMAEADRVGV